MTDAKTPNDQNHPATVIAYRYFKNTGLVKQEWAYDSHDEEGGPLYTTDAVSPCESIGPCEYLKDLHLTPESAVNAVIKRQEEAVRSAERRLSSERGVLEHLIAESLKEKNGTLKAIEYKS